MAKRSRCDPSITPESVGAKIQDYFRKMNSRDAAKLFLPPATVHWKSATPVAWLVRLETLYIGLLRVAPTGVLTSRKVKAALEMLHAKESINMSKYEDSCLMDKLDDAIRMGLAHLRGMKADKAVLDRAQRRSADCDMRVIMSLLDMLLAAAILQSCAKHQTSKNINKPFCMYNNPVFVTQELPTLLLIIALISPKPSDLNPKP